MTKFIATKSLLAECLCAAPKDFDWSEMYSGDHMRIVLPEPSGAILDQYMPGWRGDHKNLTKAIESFKESEEAGEWERSHFPMMNAGWPVELHPDVSEDEAADLIERYCGCTALLDVYDSYVIAMPGGGMDLSWDLCAAYVACGQIPPVRLLDGLPHMASGRRYPSTLGDLASAKVLACFAVARKALANQAGNLKRTEKSLRRR